MKPESNPPVFHAISLCLSLVAILSAAYLYGGFYQIDRHSPMDGVQFILLSALCFVVGGVSAVIGLARRERLNLLMKISSVTAIVFCLVIVVSEFR